MFKAITSIIFIFVFILLSAEAARTEEFCGKAINAQLFPPDYSGVYRGTVDTFGVCEFDTASADIYFDFGTIPLTIVYDGCVLQDCSNKDNVVYCTFNTSKLTLGAFETQDKPDVFNYYRVLNHFFNLEETKPKQFTWQKTGELKDNFKAYDDYVADYNKFRVFWDKFETAFFKQDFDKCESLTNFPLMDRTTNPPKKIEKANFKAFITKVFNEQASRASTGGVYKTHDWFPQRFGDHDPCFAKTYTWLYSQPYFNFTKTSGEYKLTNLYEYD